MDKQLLKYINESLSRGIDPNIISYNLRKSGYSDDDISKALQMAQSGQGGSVKPFVFGILLLVVLFLGAMLYVFWPETEHRIVPPPSLPPFEGADCSALPFTTDKEDCYMNKVREGFNCGELRDEVERSFCFRAWEDYLLESAAEN